MQDDVEAHWLFFLQRQKCYTKTSTEMRLNRSCGRRELDSGTPLRVPSRGLAQEPRALRHFVLNTVRYNILLSTFCVLPLMIGAEEDIDRQLDNQVTCGFTDAPMARFKTISQTMLNHAYLDVMQGPTLDPYVVGSRHIGPD